MTNSGESMLMIDAENKQFCDIRLVVDDRKKVYKVFFYNDIVEEFRYIEFFNILQDLMPVDEVYIHIASNGGSLETGLLLYESIRSTSAACYGFIDGECHSAATLIALACDGWEMNQNTRMMFHTWSGGYGGKASEIKSRTDFESKWFDERFREIYYPFLQKKEIDKMIEGKDFWFDVQEISKRLDKLIDFRRKQLEKLEEGEADD